MTSYGLGANSYVRKRETRAVRGRRSGNSDCIGWF